MVSCNEDLTFIDINAENILSGCRQQMEDSGLGEDLKETGSGESFFILQPKLEKNIKIQTKTTNADRCRR